MKTIVSVPLDLRAEALSANGREHWSERQARTRVLRDKGKVTHRDVAREFGRYGVTRARLTVRVTWPADGRRRDVANLAPTIKALVDGAIDAGVLPDDDDKHLVGPDLRVSDAAGATRTGLAWLRFEWEPLEPSTTVERSEG